MLAAAPRVELRLGVQVGAATPDAAADGPWRVAARRQRKGSIMSFRGLMRMSALKQAGLLGPSAARLRGG